MPSQFRRVIIMFVILHWLHHWELMVLLFLQWSIILSAFSGMGVDNAIVELDSFEVPIMDGSALPFVNMLKEVGTHTQRKN